MQDVDLIEKLTWFVRSLYERIRDWGFRHPWIARPFWYFALLVFVLGVCHGAFNYFDLYHTDADSARYMLSAMVQAQAAIIAIVITLTLIAVQLTASAYSPRVIRVFRNNPDMWILLAIYGLSMLYGLVVLKMVVGVARESVSQDVFWVLGYVPMSFECCVSVAYWLEAFTLVALFPYMLNIIDLLKPENIIQRLAIKITKDEIIDPEKDDPIQPIMDIIHGSVVKYDIATTRVGLKEVTDRAIEIIESESDIEEKISGSFCDHLGRVGRLTASNRDVDSSIEVVTNLCSFWKSTTANKFKFATSRAVQSLKLFGKDAIDHGFEFAARYTIKHLKHVGMAAARNRDAVATEQAVRSLGQLGMAAARTKIEIAAQDAAEFLGNVGKCAVENKLKDAPKQAADSLGVIGEYAAENKLKGATKQTADSLGVIGTIAAEKGGELEDAAIQAVESLRVVGKIAERNELEKAVWQAAESLGRVGKTAAKSGLRRVAEDAVGNLVFFGEFEIKKGNEGKTKQVIWLLHEIGRIAAEKGKELEDVTSQAALSLGDVGRIAAEKGKELEDAISQVAQSLIDIGIVAEENGLEDAPLQAAWSLAELTISSEGIVKTQIQAREEDIQEYRESFDKFKKLYEQRLKVEHELEELRTRKPN